MRQAQSIAGNNNLYPRTKNVHRYAIRGEKREGEREREMLWKLRYSVRVPSIVTFVIY